MEKIFIVVPVYNVEIYLERCIESILNQTCNNYELILVDDGSPDSSPQICDRYAEQHKNITVIHQQNAGLSAARNAGICYALEQGNAKSNWITFIDSDDFIHPCYLEYLYRAAKEANIEISSCKKTITSSSEIESADNAVFKYNCIEPEEYWSMCFTDAVVAWGKLYRVFLFNNIRYPVGKIFEDNFTTYKILFPCEKIAVVRNSLYYWYTNPQSITRSTWTPKKLDALEALNCQLKYFKEHGYSKAYKSSLKELLNHSIKQLMQIRHLSPEYDHIIPLVKASRKKAFRLYAKEAGLCTALAYWFDVRIKLPARRVLASESVFSFLKRRLRKKLRR